MYKESFYDPLEKRKSIASRNFARILCKHVGHACSHLTVILGGEAIRQTALSEFTQFCVESTSRINDYLFDQRIHSGNTSSFANSVGANKQLIQTADALH